MGMEGSKTQTGWHVMQPVYIFTVVTVCIHVYRHKKTG